MSQIANIQASKEFELAMQLEQGINSYSFNPQMFAASIPYMHRTNQQSLWRLIKECIKVIADDSTGYDDRNKASHREAQQMVEYLKEHGHNIPLL